MFWKTKRRNWHTPKETNRELARRVGKTPPEFLSGKDKAEARRLRAKRLRLLEDAIKKGRNPYVVNYKYPEGEFWPYGPEMQHRVDGHGLVRHGYYRPHHPEHYEYDGGDFGYTDDAGEQYWEYLAEEAHRFGIHLERLVDLAQMARMEPDELVNLAQMARMDPDELVDLADETRMHPEELVERAYRHGQHPVVYLMERHRRHQDRFH